MFPVIGTTADIVLGTGIMAILTDLAAEYLHIGDASESALEPQTMGGKCVL